MRQIFLSYSSKYRDLTERIVEAIEKKHGEKSVWWDRKLLPGDQFNPEITHALDQAKVVVVIWTDGAVDSAWVYAEAARAANQRKVVTVREKDLDPDRIPLPFNGMHAEPIDIDGLGYTEMLAAIQKRIGGKPSKLPNALPNTGFRSFLLEPKYEPLPARDITKSRASLLLATHKVVTYDDVHGVVRDTIEWAIGTPPHAMGSSALGRLLHGAGGVGKTRAMIEVVEQLAKEHGWLAGFVPRGIREHARTDMETLIARDDAPGLMLVLDYAEGRQDDVTWLADNLIARAANTQKPSRLIMLSRSAGDWWTELSNSSTKLQRLTGLGNEVYDEQSVQKHISGGDRVAMFDQAEADFHKRLSEVDPTIKRRPPPSDTFIETLQSQDDYGRPLAIQMVALLFTLGYEIEENVSDLASLLRNFLGLEYDHWKETLELKADATIWLKAIKRAVATITLVGGVDSAEDAVRLLKADPLYSEDATINIPKALEHLQKLFPRGGEGIAPLEPDLLGEHHVALVADDVLINACLDWAGDDETLRRTILTVLNRATRQEHGACADEAERQLTRLMDERGTVYAADLVAVGISTPGKLEAQLPELENIVPNLVIAELDRLYSELPRQTVRLMVLALLVSQQQVEFAREQIASETPGDTDTSLLARVRLAWSLNNCSIRNSDLGRREDALAASEEAAEIYRQLAAEHPDAFRPDLAMSLNNLGNRFSDLGRREDALAATKEAADNIRQLADAQPNAFRSDLAKSLNNLGNRFSDLGRREDALAATKEAADNFRQLADAQPDAFRPDLAANLNNLGSMLSNLGRREDALAATEEAVAIRRQLAAAQPDAFRPDLAKSLNSFGSMLSNLGRREDALTSTEEAAEIYRQLAAEHPDAFRSDLAMSLNNLGNRLSNLGRREDALAASEEAAAIYRQLAAEHPEAFRPDLAAESQQPRQHALQSRTARGRPRRIRRGCRNLPTARRRTPRSLPTRLRHEPQ